MNTTAKGDAFEKRALTVIKSMIDEKRIAVMADAYRIYEKKPYYSHDRKGDIIFDLTIEVTPPGANKYSLIYIIECKDYKTPVSIDRLESFCSKVEQVSPRNSKAVFITTSRFQKSAKNFADTKGIMLVGVDETNFYNVILYNKIRSSSSIPFLNSLSDLDVNEKFLERDIDDTILSGILKIDRTNNAIKFYSKPDIESVANEILSEIDSNISDGKARVTIETLINYVNQTLGFKVKNTQSKDELGCIDNENKVIKVNHSLYSTRRYKFVLAHEIGHCILHDGLVFNDEVLYTMSDSEYNFRTDRYTLKNDKNWIEWQANYFATCLTMPKHYIIARLFYYQQTLGLQEGKLYIDDDIVNIKSFAKILNLLSFHFELSKSSIINRIKELDMFINKSRLKSIGQIMHEHQGELII
jgi:Zn-dependent peptidase ImmA (M78 family)